jgi:hypothetical protein
MSRDLRELAVKLRISARHLLLLRRRGEGHAMSPSEIWRRISSNGAAFDAWARDVRAEERRNRDKVKSERLRQDNPRLPFFLNCRNLSAESYL